MSRRWSAVLLLLLGAAVGFGARLDDMALRDSLRYLPPNIRSYYLDKAGFDMWPAAQPRPESTGLRLIGKWGAGPSVRVTGRDSIVYLSRGSEVVVINYADTATPRVLTTIQAPGLVARSILAGNRLYVSSGFIETFDVSDPANPVRLGSLLARAPAIDVVDTLVYALYRDSLKVFNFADPVNPAMLGACRDSGYDISVCNGYAYIGDRWGLYVLDVTNPSSPHRIASWGSDVISVKARGNICCATLGNPNQPTYLKFYVLDARQPASIAPLGSLDSCGGYDMYLDDSLAFISGYYTGGHEFEMLSIADSAQPSRVGSCLTPGDGFGVWPSPSLRRAFVADYLGGLTNLDISVPSAPTYDTTLLRAGISMDVAVDGNLVCVANDEYGMVLLDVSAPDRPEEIGVLDSTALIVTRAVAVRDSFAYMGYSPSLGDLHTVDISDPTQPVSAGGVNLFNWPEDIVLRDSFIYCAEANRFQIVNVARPREPVLVGSCVLSGDVWDLDVEDTMAYVTSSVLTMVSIARPDSPRVVATWNTMVGVDVEDTIAYTCGSGAVWAVSVARPAQPYVLDTVRIAGWVSDVVVSESLAFAGGQVLYLIDKRDPRNLRVVGQWTPPHEFRRLLWTAPYLYAACYDAGVCILETMPTGIAESKESNVNRRRASVFPSVSTGRFAVDFGRRPPVDLNVYNAAGDRILKPFGRGGDEAGHRVEFDLSGYPDGVYFVGPAEGETSLAVKVVKTKGR